MDNQVNENTETEAKAEDVNLETEDNVEAISKDGPEEEKKEEVDYKEKYYYLAAEFDNAKKRFEREKDRIVKYGKENILSELLDVVDNLERVTLSLENDEDEKVKNIVIGVDMVLKQFLGALENNGLKKIDALGAQFDPNLHEAMAQEKKEGAKDQEVIQVYQQGYTLNGRLLRASKVIVANS